MKREPAAGWLLIASSVVILFVMSHHPSGHDLAEADDFGRAAGLNVAVHSMALVSVLLLFLGLLGLLRRLAPSQWAVAALVTHGFALMGVMTAAVASGFVSTAVFERMADAEGERRDLYHTLIAYTWFWNQGFAKLHLVGSSAALLLWSIAILRTRRLAPVSGIVGSIVGAAALVAFFAGHLRLDVHGFGILVAAQSAWTIWVGALLLRGGPVTADR